MFTYWTVEPPARWQAGTTGKDRTPFYFACADCRTPEAEIAAILSTDGTYSGIGLLGTLAAFDIRPAMFCGLCYAKRIAAQRVDRCTT